jgi:hypothetical protein
MTTLLIEDSWQHHPSSYGSLRMRLISNLTALVQESMLEITQISSCHCDGGKTAMLLKSLVSLPIIDEIVTLHGGQSHGTPTLRVDQNVERKVTAIS